VGSVVVGEGSLHRSRDFDSVLPLISHCFNKYSYALSPNAPTEYASDRRGQRSAYTSTEREKSRTVRRNPALDIPLRREQPIRRRCVVHYLHHVFHLRNKPCSGR
jgi:hypothetical protein